MGYRTLRECVDDLERHGQLVRIDAEVDARLEVAEIQRRVCAAGGPALLVHARPRLPLPDARQSVRHDRAGPLPVPRQPRTRRSSWCELKLDPTAALRHPWRFAGAPRSAACMLPMIVSRGDVTANETTISQLPQQVSWPNDGGAFITLPQVYTEDVREPGLAALEPRHVPRAAFRQPATSPTAKSACTTRSTARSACTTRPRSRPASRFA